MQFFAVLADISEITLKETKTYKKAFETHVESLYMIFKNKRVCQRILKHDKLITENNVCQKKFDIRNRNSRQSINQLLRRAFQHRVKEKTWKEREVKMMSIFFFFNVAFFTFSARCHVLLYFQNDIYLFPSIIHRFDWIIRFIHLKMLILALCLYRRDLKKEANNKTIGSFLLIFLFLS